MANEADDTWLADDEANLRPEVARALANAPPPPRPPRAQVHLNIIRAVPRVVWLGVLAAIALMIMIRLLSSAIDGFNRPAQVEILPDPPGAVILVQSARIRTGPGLGHPVATSLPFGENIRVTEYKNGWCKVAAFNNTPGWVYGAYVGRARGPWMGPGAMVRRVRVTRGSSTLELQRGQRFVVEKVTSNGMAVLILPRGDRVEVPANAVLITE